MKKLVFIALVLALVGIILTVNQLCSSTPNLKDVEVFQSFAGIAFLEKSSGKIYIYDSLLKEVLDIKQISELGKPIISIEKPSKY